MYKICELPASQLIEAIKNERVSAVEVAQAFIERIQIINPKINAINQFDPARILKEAKSADLAIKNKEKLGKLHGLPMTIKDTCHVSGFKCSKGFLGFFKAPSSFDATTVARLRAEGAIILGITNTPELLLSYETDNLIYGRTNNPYDLSRTPGGSSGGEAAIICAGGSPAGLGSDAGGSIRQPAHYSGICGHKPTQGMVPLTGNIPTNGPGLATQIFSMGPMSRHVEDLMLIMSVIAGPDKNDPHVPPVQTDFSKNVELHQLKIAYYYNNNQTIASPETVRTIDAVVEALRSKVALIQEDYPEPAKDIYRLHWETFVLGGDKGKGLKQLYTKFEQIEKSKLAEEFISSAEKCSFTTTQLRTRLLEVEQFRYNMMNFMKNYDLIISPVTATPARLHGETHSNIHDFSYVITHNLTGWPATVVPCGKSADGLPIGVQIAATPWNDHVCLSVAKKLQDIFGIFPIPEILNSKPQQTASLQARL